MYLVDVEISGIEHNGSMTIVSFLTPGPIESALEFQHAIDTEGNTEAIESLMRSFGKRLTLAITERGETREIFMPTSDLPEG